MALDAIDPLPDRRQDYYLAQLALMAGNRWRPEGARPYELDDFLLFQDRPPPHPDDVEDRIRMVFGAMVKKD